MPSYLRGSLLHPLRKIKEEEKREPSPLSFSNVRFWVELSRSTRYCHAYGLFFLDHIKAARRGG